MQSLNTKNDKGKLHQQRHRQQQCVREGDRQANATQAMWTKYTNNNVVAIEFSRKREHDHYTSKT